MKENKKERKKENATRKEAEKKEALFLFNLPVETGELSLGRRAVWGGRKLQLDTCEVHSTSIWNADMRKYHFKFINIR